MKNQLLKNGFYNALSGAVRIGLSLLIIPVLIRSMGVEEYGVWILASAILSILGLAEAGLATTTTVFISKDIAKEDTEGLRQTLTVTIGLILILATFAGLSLWVGAESIVSILPKMHISQEMAVFKAIQVGAIVVSTKLVQQILIGVEQAYQRYDVISFLSIIQWVLTSLGLFLVAWRGGRTFELMQWQALISVVVLLSHILLVRRILKVVDLYPVWNKEKAFEVARYSVITWLTTLGTVLFTRGDRFIVASVLGSKAVGLYAAIIDMASAINSISALPVQPILSTVSYLLVKENREPFLIQQKVKQAIQINATVALGFGAALLTMAPIIVQIVIPDVLVVKNVLSFKIAIVIYALYSINAVGYFILFSVNAVKVSMLNVLISSTVSLLFIFIGASKFGLIGACLGNIGYLITLLLPVIAMEKLKISPKLLVEWLKFPFCFLGILIAINFYFIKFISSYNYVIMSLMLLTIQSVVITIWFLKSQNIKLRVIIDKVFG